MRERLEHMEHHSRNFPYTRVEGKFTEQRYKRAKRSPAVGRTALTPRHSATPTSHAYAGGLARHAARTTLRTAEPSKRLESPRNAFNRHRHQNGGNSPCTS